MNCVVSPAECDPLNGLNIIIINRPILLCGIGKSDLSLQP